MQVKSRVGLSMEECKDLKKARVCVMKGERNNNTVQYIPGSHTIPVCLKVFKSKDIQDTNGCSEVGLWLEYGSIDFPHNPNKKSAIDALDECITHICCLTMAQMGYLRLKRVQLEINNAIIINYTFIILKLKCTNKGYFQMIDMQYIQYLYKKFSLP